MKANAGFNTDLEFMIKHHKIEYLVEANTFEQHCIWDKFVNDYKVLTDKDWMQDYGRSCTIGWIGDRPIVLSLFIAKIKRKNVGFWYLSSELADYDLAEKVLSQYKFKARSDAQNFANVLRALTDEVESAIIAGSKG